MGESRTQDSGCVKRQGNSIPSVITGNAKRGLFPNLSADRPTILLLDLLSNKDSLNILQTNYEIENT